jgi:rod shape-determining protein MreC
VLLFQSNPYQQSVYLSSANAVSASVYEGFSSITSYFHLRDINNDLQKRNAMLEMEVVGLRNQVSDYKMQIPDTSKLQPVLRQYDFVIAHVISNSISQTYNYITINRGTEDGIREEMGVVDQNGVVGIVNVVGRHSARIISLLNTHMRLSCKIKNSSYFGSMMWDGNSPYYALLQELPKHARYNKGDTIVTSGYSAVFPEGIIVGTIVSNEKNFSGNFETVKVKLTTDFTRLSTVRAIKNNMKPELKSIERKDDKESTTDAGKEALQQ